MPPRRGNDAAGDYRRPPGPQTGALDHEAMPRVMVVIATANSLARDWCTMMKVERARGIEPPSSAWKAVALPLSYTRDVMVPAAWNRTGDLALTRGALYRLS